MQMRAWLSVLAIVLLAHAASATLFCEMPVCVQGGGNCTASGSICKENYYCNITDAATSQRSCIPAIKLGGSCVHDGDCSGNSLSQTLCWNGTCSSIKYTQTEGQACSNLDECTNKFYCNNTGPNSDKYTTGFCMPFLQQGANCSGNFGPCAGGLSCNLDVCIPNFSVQQGGQCNHAHISDYSLICAPGLYCSQNRSAPLHTPGTCLPGFESSKKPCDLNSPSCPDAREYCACDDQYSYCQAPATFTKSQASAASAWFTCLNNAACGAGDPTCCKSQQCFLLDTQTKAQKSFVHSCYNGVFDECSGLSKGELAGIIIGACAGGILLIAVAAYCIRRRKHHHHQYEPIHH